MLIFLYTGNCTITPENVMALVDLGQAYELSSLKTHCDQFLATTEVSADNALKYLEYANRYSLTKCVKKILDFIKTDTDEVLKSDYFVHISKDILIEIAKMEHFTIKEEDFFEAV